MLDGNIEKWEKGMKRRQASEKNCFSKILWAVPWPYQDAFFDENTIIVTEFSSTENVLVAQKWHEEDPLDSLMGIEPFINANSTVHLFTEGCLGCYHCFYGNWLFKDGMAEEGRSDTGNKKYM